MHLRKHSSQKTYHWPLIEDLTTCNITNAVSTFRHYAVIPRAVCLPFRLCELLRKRARENTNRVSFAVTLTPHQLPLLYLFNWEPVQGCQNPISVKMNSFSPMVATPENSTFSPLSSQRYIIRTHIQVARDSLLQNVSFDPMCNLSSLDVRSSYFKGLLAWRFIYFTLQVKEEGGEKKKKKPAALPFLWLYSEIDELPEAPVLQSIFTRHSKHIL